MLTSSELNHSQTCSWSGGRPPPLTSQTPWRAPVRQQQERKERAHRRAADTVQWGWAGRRRKSTAPPANRWRHAASQTRYRPHTASVSDRYTPEKAQPGLSFKITHAPRCTRTPSPAFLSLPSRSGSDSSPASFSATHSSESLPALRRHGFQPLGPYFDAHVATHVRVFQF